MSKDDDNQKMEQDKPSIDLGNSLLTQEDALRCLSGQVHVILPVPNARACNNLNEYLMKSTQKSSSASKAKNRNFNPTFAKEPLATPLVRNFDKILKNPQNQSPPTKQKRTKPDVFSKAEQLDEGSGPLMLLKERIGQTVKVLTRRRRKVPYISRTLEYKGTLILFDKHMNVYLKDVIESFKYESDEKKIIKRARHRESLMLRGDNIILVS